MNRMNTAMLLQAYKEKYDEATDLAVRGVTLRAAKASIESVEALEKEFHEVNKVREDIAVEIADRLTNVKKLQFEVVSGSEVLN